MQVQRLFIYPIKSLRPVEVQYARLTETGFEYDRIFVLVEETPTSEDGITQHLTIKTMSELCLFRQSIDNQQKMLTVTYKLAECEESIHVPLSPNEPMGSEDRKEYVVDIFGSRAICQDTDSEIAYFFSKHLHRSVRLLKIVDSTYRDVPAPSLIPRRTITKSFSNILPSWLVRSETQEELHVQSRIYFADAAPLLVTTTASEEDTRSRLPGCFQDEDIITKFRPNIHIDVSSESKDQQVKPYAEDDWKAIHVHPSRCPTRDGIRPDEHSNLIEIKLVFRTVRCQSLNVDYETGKLVPKERQLYRLLTKDRRVNSVFPAKPCFGMYGFAEPIGSIISVGDKIEVVEAGV